MRQALVGLTLVTLGACAAEQATDFPLDDDPLPPPPETGQAFHLSFDGLDDRVLVPWHESFPTEVFTAVAWIRLPAPPNGRAAIIARGEDDNSFNLTWQLYVGREGELEAMLEAYLRVGRSLRCRRSVAPRGAHPGCQRNSGLLHRR